MKVLLNLFSLKLLTSLLGLLYSILQVRYFGATRVIEVYFAAQSLIYLVTSLSQSGQLSEIFLPEYHRLNTIKKGLGFKGLNVVLNRLFLWGSLIILLVFLFTPFFINLLVPGFSINEKEQAILIFRILLPYLFLQINNSFFITVLNAAEKFGRAELLGITNTLINILSLIVLYYYIGIWALVISLLLGKIIEFIFYTNQLYKIGFKYRLLMSMPDFNHNLFFKTMQYTFFYVGATQVYSIILTACISFLPEGTYAVFKYVQNLGNKIQGLFIQPFITVFFTRYSILVQKLKSANNEFKKNMQSVINMNAIIIIGGILLGEYIIEVIWGGEKFNSDNVTLAYLFLIFNLIGILISGIGSVYRKMAVAHSKGSKLYLFWVASQLLSAILTFLLINNFKICGLLFVGPINIFLMGMASYLVYQQTTNPNDFPFFNRQNSIAIILVSLAIFVKFISLNFGIIQNKTSNTIFLFFCTIFLSLPLVFSIYKLFKFETNN